jgi:hypothetical protein
VLSSQDNINKGVDIIILLCSPFYLWKIHFSLHLINGLKSVTQKEFDKIRTDINLASIRKKRKCFVAGCDKWAIQSHLIQRNGILNHIITNGHLYEIAFLQFPKPHYNIKKVGWKDALTFYGFCAYHDSKIFEPIEKNNINLTDYPSLLLLSYRPLLHEYRVKEIIREALMNTLFHKKLLGQINIEDVQHILGAETIVMWDLEFMLQSLEIDLAEASQNFSFHILSIPKIEVCTSTVFSFTSLSATFLTNPADLKNKELLPSLLFHLIPNNQDSKLVLGYHKLSENYLKPSVMII